MESHAVNRPETTTSVADATVVARADRKVRTAIVDADGEAGIHQENPIWRMDVSEASRSPVALTCLYRPLTRGQRHYVAGGRRAFSDSTSLDARPSLRFRRTTVDCHLRQ